MNELIYKPARPEDAQILFALSKALIERYEDLTQIDLPKVLTWVKRKIETQLHSYTCVWKDGKRVAYFRLVAQETESELDDFYVLDGYRGQGIGSQILRHCIAEAKGPVFVYVFTKNTAAISLYARFGFIRTRAVNDSRCIMTRDA